MRVGPGPPLHSSFSLAAWPSGSGKGLQSPVRQFDSDRRLQQPARSCWSIVRAELSLGQRLQVSVVETGRGQPWRKSLAMIQTITAITTTAIAPSMRKWMVEITKARIA